MNDLKENENFIHNKFGYCYYALEEDYSIIYNLYVEPQYRRSGHSKILLNYAINEIRKLEYYGEIQIQAVPREESISLDELIKYYKSLGLKILN